MAEIEKKLTTSKIGRRVFISRSSLLALLEENIKKEYPSSSEQMDYIYHKGIDAWKTNIIDPIKQKYPKPS